MMTPLHPFAAAAAGAVLGLAALTAPNTQALPGMTDLARCEGECARHAVPVPMPAVGAVAQPAQVHRITQPGRYGLSEPPKGQIYAVFQGRLVRIEMQSGVIRSVLRPIGRILD